MSSNKVVQNMSTKYTGFSCLLNDDSDNDNIKNKITNKESEKKPEKEIQNIKNNIIVNYSTCNVSDTNSSDWVSIKSGKKVNIVKKLKKPYKQKIQEDSDEEVKLPEKKVEQVIIEEIENNIDNETLEKDVLEYKFQNKWYIWIHEVDSKDWSSKSYKIIHTIDNISDFWQFFNNTHNLNQWKYNFFVMKGTSHPTWEHSTNRNGGTCSIRIDISQSVDILEQLAILLVNESLTEEINDINGISFAAKGNWCVIKIWNRDNKNNISNQMPSYLRKIYPAISIKYKENIPEY
jgi:hypothetical protein